MILLTAKGIKYGRKKYKEHKAGKEKKLREERGEVDIEDPSEELDSTCQAEIDRHPSKLSKTNTNQSKSRHSSTSSASTTSAERALENDPGFREYMAKHRSLYLQHQRERGQLPSYNAVMQEDLTPASSTRNPQMAAVSPATLHSAASHCSCHDCIARLQNTSPGQSGHQSAYELAVPNLSLTSETRSLTPVRAAIPISELPGASVANYSGQVAELDNTPAIFELPGNLPAMLPEPKREMVAELPAEPSKPT